MEPEEILHYCLQHLDGVVLAENWGERGIFYNPDNALKKGVYVLTIKEKDGDNDKASDINRPGVFRVNLGIRKNTFVQLFASIPKRPAAGGVVEIDCDFTALDKITPHPVYAWMGWISVLNPSTETFELLKPLIDESHAFAMEKYKKKKL
ncbi:MAG: DUF6194 family protein [Oscillospiraceae bacterium]|nr:DUF6194 family protein [Oscillospiraceae bacterium]